MEAKHALVDSWLVDHDSLSSLAADYDNSWLRGSQTIGAAPVPPARTYRIWAGVYGGVQAGADFHGVNFHDAPLEFIADAQNQDKNLNGLGAALPGMAGLPKINSNGSSYGGFLGYNWQIDDVVFGVEANANRSSLSTSAGNLTSRNYIITSGNYIFAPTATTVTSTANVAVSTYTTLRGRLGWAFGNFLPYLVAGVSFSQIDSSRSVDINYLGACVPQPPATCPNVTIGGDYQFGDVSHGKYVIGFDGALGIDYMLTRYAFVRGEVEYLHLGTPNNINMSTVSTRLGIGLRY